MPLRQSAVARHDGHELPSVVAGLLADDGDYRLQKPKPYGLGFGSRNVTVTNASLDRLDVDPKVILPWHQVRGVIQRKNLPGHVQANQGDVIRRNVLHGLGLDHPVELLQCEGNSRVKPQAVTAHAALNTNRRIRHLHSPCRRYCYELSIVAYANLTIIP
ncbi:MAG TPA: hypothetical protein VK502_00165 [Candidatus Saccharimonadales bacterium]|nr:hypothetical protein [Candidatus Saccharimonadales bacterium]